MAKASGLMQAFWLGRLPRVLNLSRPPPAHVLSSLTKSCSARPPISVTRVTVHSRGPETKTRPPGRRARPFLIRVRSLFSSALTRAALFHPADQRSWPFRNSAIPVRSYYSGKMLGIG